MSVTPAFKTIQVIDHVVTGRRFRVFREAAGMSLRELARRLKLSASFVSDLELGRRNWTDELVKRFDKAIPAEGGKKKI